MPERRVVSGNIVSVPKVFVFSGEAMARRRMESISSSAFPVGERRQASMHGKKWVRL